MCDSIMMGPGWRVRFYVHVWNVLPAMCFWPRGVVEGMTSFVLRGTEKLNLVFSMGNFPRAHVLQQ